MATILSKEETIRFNKLRKAFKPWENKGWVVESPDDNLLCFFILGDDDNHYVEADYKGSILSYKGICYAEAKKMVQSYIPSFRLANKL